MSETTVTRDVAEADFAAEVLAASRSRGVVVDFWAPWCGPCHQLAPVLERVAARHPHVDLVKVNVDQAPALASRYQVQGIPAVKAFRNGAVAGELTGVQPEAVLERLFAGVAPREADRLVDRAAATSDASEREPLLRAALEDDPGHVPAVTALARLLAERGETEQARGLLDRVPADPEVDRLRAELNLTEAGRDPGALDRLRAAAGGGDQGAALELGRALAAQQAHAEALEVLLRAVRHPATRDEARATILEVFRMLGDDHELVRSARPKLAAALF